MDELKTTYQKILKLDTSLSLESFEVVKLVNDYRNYWKPEKVKTVLLAESHVFTDKSETEIFHTINLPAYPRNYVRFVYNLSYGQKNTLKEILKNNSGTWQYWKLFMEISGKDFRVLNNKDDFNKLNQKIQLLNYLKEKGVWLLDCSIVGLYDNGKKPPQSTMEQILKTSYRGFCEPVILKEKPKNILVIGKSVFSLLAEDLIRLKMNIDWIHQPNARLNNANRKGIANIQMELI